MTDKEQERVEEVRDNYPKYMQGFPHSLYPIKERCLCQSWKCIWFEKYKNQDEKFPIGWCKRYEPDPDAGYIMAYQLPPCVVWSIERQSKLPQDN